MNNKNIYCIRFLVLIVVFTILNIGINHTYAAGSFSAKFTNPVWNGQKVPNGQQCKRFGGKAKTPRIAVTNIPTDANAIILWFDDRSFQPMNRGGHGKIGYLIGTDVAKITIPSVKGHTFRLPLNFFMISAHRAPKWDKAGAYMPPCSGGKNNRYVVVVKAAKVVDKRIVKILAEVSLEMGRY